MSQLMRESQAMRRWCPFAVVHAFGTSGSAAVNRTPAGHATKCLGRGCMAWLEHVEDSHDPMGCCSRLRIGQ